MLSAPVVSYLLVSEYNEVDSTRHLRARQLEGCGAAAVEAESVARNERNLNGGGEKWREEGKGERGG